MDTASNGIAALPGSPRHLKSLTIRERLNQPAQLEEFRKAMPTHCKPERMARVALTAMTRTPKLADCDQASFFKCLLDLSQWGLEPDGRRAHLIPFRNNKLGITECQLIIDYKGLVELVMRSGTVSKIHADVVCENDEFEYDRGDLIHHKIDFAKPRGKPYAAYCLVRMKDGSEKCEVLPREEVEAIRKRSRAGNAGPWVTDWNEMAKKTAFRRASKWLQISAEIADALERDDDRPLQPISELRTPVIPGPISGNDLVGDPNTIDVDADADDIDQSREPGDDSAPTITSSELATKAERLGCPEALCLTVAEEALGQADPLAFIASMPWKKSQ